MQDTATPGSFAHYAAPVAEFVDADGDAIVGRLAAASQGSVEGTQITAWLLQVQVLQEALRGTDGFIALEFEVPRLGSRIDAVVLTHGLILPIEFKVGANEFLKADEEQTWDYALDLKNFHRGSHDQRILPILVATEAESADAAWRAMHSDGVFPPRHVNSRGLRQALRDATALGSSSALEGARWVRERYQPTPTIIQAARALYSRHTVDSISRSDAAAVNLGVTSQAIEGIIADAQREKFKAIVFVTGVPGAGKTLVGLNIATRHRRALIEDPAHAVLLSGNKPLVDVLQAALTQDEYDRQRAAGQSPRKGDIAQPIKQFIQLVHHFRDSGLKSTEPPADHVIVFDEAQRAWNRRKTIDFMKRKKGRRDFNQSEPEFQLSYMDRRNDWAVAVCLVGGGQEIHDGEAGIATWLEAVHSSFPHWRVFLSDRLTESEPDAGSALELLTGRANVFTTPDLHLAVSMRSFRAENVSAFVKAVLDRDRGRAREHLSKLGTRYPIAITRDLAAAKRWVRERARGSERYGLVASSSAERLRPHAIDVRTKADPVKWFLGPREHIRSSWYLEEPATEFQVQGLELDWVCVTWDADLRMSDGMWSYRAFAGDRWNTVRKPERQRYLLNAYRVLLTRARQGMVLFVPRGDGDDATRLPQFYDETYGYLTEIGVPSVS